MENVHDKHRQRMYEKADAEGLDGFNDCQLLEYILFFAIPRGDTNPTAHALLSRFGSLEAVLEAGYEEIVKVDGVGPKSARLICSYINVFKRYRINKTKPKKQISTVRDAGEYLRSIFINCKNEEVYLLLLDVKSKLIKTSRISVGTLTQAPVYIRTVLEEALRANAKKVILSHCHPQGSTAPSKMDIDITKRVFEALKAADISLLDHIIVGEDGYTSIIAQQKIEQTGDLKQGYTAQYEIDY